MSDLSTPSPLERIAPHIPVPQGYYCENQDELVSAYQLLGSTDAIIKPVGSAAGEQTGRDRPNPPRIPSGVCTGLCCAVLHAGGGIMIVNNTQQVTSYEFPAGPVVIEELLELDPGPDGTSQADSPAVHFMRGQLLEPLMVDQIMDGVSWR